MICSGKTCCFVFFQCYEHHKHNSIDLHCIGGADVPKSGKIKPRLSACLNTTIIKWGNVFQIWVNWPYKEKKRKNRQGWLLKSFLFTKKIFNPPICIGNRHITVIDINASTLSMYVQWGAAAQLDDSSTKLLLGGRNAGSFTLPWTRSGVTCCTLFTVYTVCRV